MFPSIASKLPFDLPWRNRHLCRPVAALFAACPGTTAIDPPPRPDGCVATLSKAWDKRHQRGAPRPASWVPDGTDRAAARAINEPLRDSPAARFANVSVP
jgi:hypothetical protein